MLAHTWATHTPNIHDPLKAENPDKAEPNVHIMLGWVDSHTRTQQRNQKSNKKMAQLLVKKPCRKDGGTHIEPPVFEARFLAR